MDEKCLAIKGKRKNRKEGKELSDCHLCGPILLTHTVVESKKKSIQSTLLL